MGHRRAAREAAMQIWYEVDVAHVDVASAWQTFVRQQPLPTETEAFAKDLVFGVARERGPVDALISEHSTHWRLSRMAAVDRNILRIGVFELLHCPDIPIRVTLNEAIEIGKKYGTEESGSFINGILDQIAKGLDKPLE